MLLPIACLLLQSPAQAADGSGTPPSRVEVRVDTRVELLTLLARLGGFQEYGQQSADSPYADRVDEYFGPLKDHPVFARLESLRMTSGVSFDAIPSLAVHLGPLPELAELAPLESNPERFDARWGGVAVRPFLEELRDFVQVSEATSFFDEERDFYAEVERRLGQRLAQSRALPWLDAFFGARGTASYTATPGLLCGGGNFGVGIRYPDGRPEEIRPVFGCWSWDDEGLPLFDEGYLPLFVHELCHSYTNAYVDRFADQLQPAGERLHATCAEVMARQAYGDWRTMMYESFVRACVVRCRLVTEGRAAAEQQALEEVGRGFRWVPALARRLGEFEAARERYPSFADFVPELVKQLEREAEALEKAAASAPRVVSIVPASGALDVDPGLREIVVTFDREMRDQSWSVVGDAKDQPKLRSLAYDEARKVLRLEVELEPGRTYRFGLNSAKFQGFRAQDGTPLEPLEVTFTTRR